MRNEGPRRSMSSRVMTEVPLPAALNVMGVRDAVTTMVCSGSDDGFSAETVWVLSKSRGKMSVRKAVLPHHAHPRGNSGSLVGQVGTLENTGVNTGSQPTATQLVYTSGRSPDLRGDGVHHRNHSPSHA